MEAAHRTSLAKGEVGIREKKVVPTLREFAEHDFKAYVEATFQAKPNTAHYYKNGIKNLVAFEPMSGAVLTEITTEHIAAFRRNAPRRVSQFPASIASYKRCGGCSH
jgi:hypothetical protein